MTLFIENRLKIKQINTYSDIFFYSVKMKNDIECSVYAINRANLLY